MSHFTDDTVMTVAVADALLNHSAVNEWPNRLVVKKMRQWGKRYPYAGYGGYFRRWLVTENAGPYGSYGNGSAMRVSSAGWLYDSLEKTIEMAKHTAEVTHNHPEGIKGAECTAAVIYLARTGKDKNYIRDFVTKRFGYDLSETLDEMRKRHEHVESCMDSLPKALVSFLEGTSFEDTIRNAVSLGGDTDTIGAIAGSMAEAFFGIPEWLKEECFKRIPDDMKEILKHFITKRDNR